MYEIVKLENVYKSFGNLQVLKKLNLSIKKGEVVSIIGPSGSGKSTILRCINYLEKIDTGKIYFENHVFNPKKNNIYDYRRNYGFVFQSFNLFPHLNVLDNITLAPRIILKKNNDEAIVSAEKLLESVGLSEKKYSYPRQLSGGQQQRVAIARALAMNPKVMLMDEITSALDPSLTLEVLKVVSDLAKQGMTMILVTHEINFAKDISNKIVFIKDGMIIEEGSPRVLCSSPQKEQTREFLSNIIFK